MCLWIWSKNLVIVCHDRLGEFELRLNYLIYLSMCVRERAYIHCWFNRKRNTVLMQHQTKLNAQYKYVELVQFTFTFSKIWLCLAGEGKKHTITTHTQPTNYKVNMRYIVNGFVADQLNTNLMYSTQQYGLLFAWFTCTYILKHFSVLVFYYCCCWYFLAITFNLVFHIKSVLCADILGKCWFQLILWGKKPHTVYSANFTHCLMCGYFNTQISSRTMNLISLTRRVCVWAAVCMGNSN